MMKRPPTRQGREVGERVLSEKGPAQADELRRQARLAMTTATPTLVRQSTTRNKRERGPGSRITEAELVKEYEVARSTARRMLAALREEGLIYTVPQRGSYVRLPVTTS